MILVAIGSNLVGPLGSALETLRQVPVLLAAQGINVLQSSRIYETAPIGPAKQGSYFNAVIAIDTRLMPQPLLGALQQVEAVAGRRRAARRWAERTLDLDLISYNSLVSGWDKFSLPRADVPRPVVRGALVLPHPGMHLRPFVVRPLLDFAPLWHHPVTGETAFTMWRRLKSQTGGQVLQAHGALV